MAGVKITSLIANTAARVEEQQRVERDEDAKTIIELMEDELNDLRGSVDLLHERVSQLEKEDEGA